jgi:uncharacterized repeat protein (TIGR01451 family)
MSSGPIAIRARVLTLLVVLAGSAAVAPRASRACILDMYLSGSNPTFSRIFPNWTNTPITAFDMVYCDAVTCLGYEQGDLAGLTILNYGTATGGATGDLTNMYFYVFCTAWGAKSPLVQTMTYAGVWTVGGTPYPAWTWEPAVPWVFANDPCGKNCTADCLFTMSVFVDVGSCPAEGATVALGPNYDEITDPVESGGATDQYDCRAPWDQFQDTNPKTIFYTYKEVDQDMAAPGDTVTYTITYGLPGSAPLSGVVITDTLPPYTHYAANSAVPALDPGWAPDPGPPLRLRWTIPGPIAVAGGPTGVVTFQATLDWGNGESFEPGSGDVSAPEGVRVQNSAHVTFAGTSCTRTSAVASPVGTIVRRYLLWEVADNDLLFGPSLGQPPEEVVYTIFIKNMSGTRTWWDVRVWDTVPGYLDTWCADCGLDDLCVGWTMTPTGCAAASPGASVTGSTTLLTWRLDMGPGATSEMRWKAQVKPTSPAGSTAIGVATVWDRGRTGVVGGTGRSIRPKTFAHLAIIALPTTYVSYVAFGGLWAEKGTSPPFFLDFFSLNKKTQFELRSLEYAGLGYATVGGPSASIGCLIGDCLGGFPGNGNPCPLAAIPGGGIPGCKVERIPAQYYHPGYGTQPFNFLYKVVSNSPMCWQALIDDDRDCADHLTFAPSTTMSYTGLIHYFWRRTDSGNQVSGMGDSIALASTGKNVYGNYDPAQVTTIHLFQFDYPTLTWMYRRSFEVDGECQAFDDHTYTADEGPWRSISSDTNLVVVQGYNWHASTVCCCGCCGYEAASLWPTRELGNTVLRTGDTAYGWVSDAKNYLAGDPKCIVGNVGAVDATWEVRRYVPDPGVPNRAGIPPGLKATTGTWLPAVQLITPAGFAAPGNPGIFPRDGGVFKSGTTSLFKVRLVSGGPIQIFGGINVFTHWGGGAVLHASSPIGSQAGIEFWLHHTYNLEKNDKCGAGGESTYTVDVFCPRTGMTINATSELGMSATYTTTGPDQCVAFMGFTQEAVPNKVNYKYTVLPNASQGNVIAMYILCCFEKGYTAPFLATSTHYQIVAPPVVFVGQNFWITLVVVDATNTTVPDYCGTTSFTSTDSNARIQGSAMDGYNYTWTSSVTPCGSAPWDNGVKVFVNVTLQHLGPQTIIAVDTNDGSITGMGTLTVVGVDVKLSKEPRLAVAASGDTIQFRLCWSNYSSASAFTFVVTDAVPMGTSFVPEALVAALNCGSTDGVPLGVSYTTSTLGTMPAAASFTAGNPVSGTRWLRWTVQAAGVETTGCACFRVKVD